MKFKARENQESSNFQSNKIIQAKIGNPAKMLKMFTKDLYKHPLQTAIQEYINNARDAHIMVGKDTSTIEITAPTVANQNVIIRDYGPGLSVEDVENIFASIAVSNKDDSDLFNGGFGIGSKSWFSVNTSFMVISIYNKQKTYYTVSFDESKGIFISEDFVESTVEKNGVEVHLPLANKEQINDAHRAVFRAVEFWEAKPKLINCELDYSPIKFEDADYTLISDDIENEPRVVVTLGRTPYSIKELKCYYDLKRKFKYLNVAIHFKVGEMNLHNTQEVGPDREAFNIACNDAIFQKANKIYEKIVNKLNKKLEKADGIDQHIEFLDNPIISQMYHREGYEKEIFEDTTIVFHPNRYGKNKEQMGLKIRGMRADWLCVEGSATQAETYLSNTRRVTDIIINNVELKQKELRLAISSHLESVPRPSRHTKVFKGAYMFDEGHFNEEQIKELKKYFKVTNLSDIEYEKPEKKEKTKRDTDIFNAMKHNGYYNANVRMKFSELTKDELYVTKDEFDKMDYTWEEARKAYSELRVKILMVGKGNAKKLKNLGLKKLNPKKIRKQLADLRKKQLEELKEKAKESGFTEAYQYNELYNFISGKFSYYRAKEEILKFHKTLKGFKVEHPLIEEFCNLDFERICNVRNEASNYSKVMDDLKIKQNVKIKNFFERLQREYPLLGNNLFSCQNNIHNHKEIKHLLDLAIKEGKL